MRSYDRVNQAEIQRRVDMLMAFCAQGHSSSVLIKTACHKWNVTERQAKRYLQKAREQQKKLATQPIEESYTQILQKINYVYQLGIQARDYELARKAGADLIKLYKEHRKDLLNDTTQSDQSRLVKSDELEELIRSLEKEREKFPE